VSFTVPAGQATGTYTIQAVYSGGNDFQGSQDQLYTLTITKANTTTTTGNATTTFSTGSQTINLSANVTSTGNTINTASLTFPILASLTNPLGTARSGTLLTGASGTVVFTISAGQAAGTYTIVADYSGDTNFQGSTDSTHTLTISKATATIAAAAASATFSNV